MRIKPLTASFVIAEVLDLSITTVGISLVSAVSEAWKTALWLEDILGWNQLLFVKLLVTICVAVVLQLVPFKTRLIWLIPTVASLPVIWNVLVIAAEIFAGSGR